MVLIAILLVLFTNIFKLLLASLSLISVLLYDHCCCTFEAVLSASSGYFIFHFTSILFQLEELQEEVGRISVDLKDCHKLINSMWIDENVKKDENSDGSIVLEVGFICF